MRGWLANFNFQMIFIVSVLSLFSLAVLKSVAPMDFDQQILFLVIGIVVYLIFSRLNYQILTHLAWPIYGLTVVLLSLTFVMGTTVRGSVRWLQIGQFGFQPSELAKPMLIVFGAALLTRLDIRRLSHFLLTLGLFLLPTFLIFRQPDLGSSLVVVAIFGALILVVGVKFVHALLVLTPVMVILPFLWLVLKPYQQQRIVTFLNPWTDPLGSGYNVLQSMIAIGSGQFFGRGLGHGIQSQLRFLPERQADFIFASLAEELGFVGSVLVLIAYSWLLWLIIKVIERAKDEQGVLIAVGVLAMFLVQVGINIGMNMGLVPITGITLPFISAGGSSLIASFISLGMVENVLSQQRLKVAELEIGREN